jgi:hypothetical protein
MTESELKSLIGQLLGDDELDAHNPALAQAMEQLMEAARSDTETGAVSPELLAAFIDGTLPQEEQERLEALIAAHGDAVADLSAAQEWLGRIEQREAIAPQSLIASATALVEPAQEAGSASQPQAQPEKTSWRDLFDWWRPAQMLAGAAFGALAVAVILPGGVDSPEPSAPNLVVDGGSPAGTGIPGSGFLPSSRVSTLTGTPDNSAGQPAAAPSFADFGAFIQAVSTAAGAAPVADQATEDPAVINRTQLVQALTLLAMVSDIPAINAEQLGSRYLQFGASLQQLRDQTDNAYIEEFMTFIEENGGFQGLADIDPDDWGEVPQDYWFLLGAYSDAFFWAIADLEGVADYYSQLSAAASRFQSWSSRAVQLANDANDFWESKFDEVGAETERDDVTIEELDELFDGYVEEFEELRSRINELVAEFFALASDPRQQQFLGTSPVSLPTQ